MIIRAAPASTFPTLNASDNDKKKAKRKRRTGCSAVLLPRERSALCVYYLICLVYTRDIDLLDESLVNVIKELCSRFFALFFSEPVAEDKEEVLGHGSFFNDMQI